MASTTLSLPSTTTSSLPSSTDTQSTGSTTSSPLLFFVALGFWGGYADCRIIVGVKYCFRYSQRNRRGQAFEEDVDLATLHPFVGLHHPVQRRRREKKLLTQDQVNERFPVMTYKAWRAQRERAGLSAEGGIATQNADGTPVAPRVASRPASIRETESPTSSPTPSRPSTPTPTTPAISPEASSPKPAPPTFPIQNSESEKQPLPDPETLETPTASSSKHRDSTLSADPEDEEDHDIPSELLTTTGDNCAICIELLEDEDEVRGLTCGHCYHQTCLDPWFTQRRASCPLCKADYYIPKPPAEPAETTTPTTPIAQPEHWAPIFFRPFRPVVSPTRGYGPGYTRQLEVRQQLSGNGVASTSQPQSVSAWPFRRVHLGNPFRRTRTDVTTTNNEVSAMERGEG